MRAIFIRTAATGAALVLYALVQLGQKLRSTGWRAAPAVIVQSDLVQSMTMASVSIHTAQPVETLWYRPEVV